MKMELSPELEASASRFSISLMGLLIVVWALDQETLGPVIVFVSPVAREVAELFGLGVELGGKVVVDVHLH